MKNKLSFIAALATAAALAIPVLAGTNVVDMSSFQDAKERTRALDKSLLQLETLAVHGQTGAVYALARIPAVQVSASNSAAILSGGVSATNLYIKGDGTTGTVIFVSGVLKSIT